MVRIRRRLQCHGHGTARTESGRSLQLLLQEVQSKDGPAAGRSSKGKEKRRVYIGLELLLIVFRLSAHLQD